MREILATVILTPSFTGLIITSPDGGNDKNPGLDVDTVFARVLSLGCVPLTHN
jgi:hypothetical protein